MSAWRAPAGVVMAGAVMAGAATAAAAPPPPPPPPREKVTQSCAGRGPSCTHLDMRVSSSAVSTARLLLSLAASGREAEVRIDRDGRTAAKVRVRGGCLAALQSPRAIPLGDLLRRAGELDVARYDHAMRSLPPRHVVGAWLVAVGAASRGAVERALRDQARAQMRTLLELAGKPRVMDDHDGTPVRGFPFEPDLADVVCGALTQLLAEQGRLSSVSEAISPTPLGDKLLPRLRLPALLGVAWPARTLSSEVHHMLRLCGLAAPMPERQGYSLLLRKRCELRRGASPHALLELPAVSSQSQQRAAYRKLAGALHPDRFEHAGHALVAASTEVLLGLARAERALRSTAVHP